MEDLIEILVKQGFSRENITTSEIVIDSKNYSVYYKESKGSYSDFDNGWCLFFTYLSPDKFNENKGILHKAEKMKIF